MKTKKSPKLTKSTPDAPECATAEHFKIFKLECEYWIEEFGLREWDIYFSYKDVEGNDIAYLNWDTESRWAVINLCSENWKNHSGGVNEWEVRKCAYHEIAELLLAKFCDLAEGRYSNKEELQAERHAIIQRLTNTHWEMDAKRRGVKRN